MKIVKNFETRLVINIRLQRNAEEKNAEQKSGMKECNFNPNLKFLIVRFSSKMTHHFLLTF